MRRYWIDSHWIRLPEVIIQGDDFHHICHVCRQGPGHRFEVIDGSGSGVAYLVEIVEKNKNQAVARVLEERPLALLRPPWIRLALSMPRYSTVESLLEKMVELGVKSVHPFVSDYSFVRKLDKLPGKKVDRWQRIIRSSTQQCGRGDLMELESVQTFEQVLAEINRCPNAQCLFSYEGESQSSLRAGLMKAKSSSPQDLWLIIGGEGGFSSREVETMAKIGFAPLTLGDQVLRVETACVAVVSCAKYEFDLMTSIDGGDNGSV